MEGVSRFDHVPQPLSVHSAPWVSPVCQALARPVVPSSAVPAPAAAPQQVSCSRSRISSFWTVLPVCSRHAIRRGPAPTSPPSGRRPLLRRPPRSPAPTLVKSPARPDHLVTPPQPEGSLREGSKVASTRRGRKTPASTISPHFIRGRKAEGQGPRVWTKRLHQK